jgi:hypothetical protein
MHEVSIDSQPTIDSVVGDAQKKCLMQVIRWAGKGNNLSASVMGVFLVAGTN